MTGLWQNMAMWQRLGIALVAVGLLLGGGLAWGSRAGGTVAGDLSFGQGSSGAACPVPVSGDAPPAALASKEQAPAIAGGSWTPSGNAELATFALG